MRNVLQAMRGSSRGLRSLRLRGPLAQLLQDAASRSSWSCQPGRSISIARVILCLSTL